MSVRANATMVFMDYEVQDTGIQLHFLCPDPGPGKASDYYVFVTDAEVGAIRNLAQAQTLITTKLARKLRAAVIADKLDQYIGQSVVV